MLSLMAALAILSADDFKLPEGIMGKRGTYNVRIGQDPGLCSGRVETLAAVGFNGAGDVADFEQGDGYSSFKPGQRISPPTRYEAGWDPKHFIAQTNKEECWGAVLAMLTARVGLNIRKEQFTTTLRAHCRGKTSDFATSNQVVFAFTQTLGLEGSWIGDLDGSLQREAASSPSVIEGIAQTIGNLAFFGKAPLLNPPTFAQGTEFQDITWTRTFADKHTVEEGLFPVYNTAEFLLQIYMKRPVVAGLGGKKNGHVVMVTSLIARPGGFRDKSSSPVTLQPGWKTRIESVGYVDPAGNGEVRWMAGDQFIKEARFMFGVQLM